MASFFQGFGKVWKWVAIGIGSFVMVFLIATIVIGRFFSAAPISVPDGAALRLTLDGQVVEQRSVTDPLTALQAGGALPPEVLLRELTEALDRAAKDDRIKALTIETGPFFAAMPAHLDSIGDALKRFKASGKPVIAYSDYYSNSSYYLAAHAGDILVGPMGGVGVTGYASYQPYLKGALDRFKVNVNIFKAGKYKNAVEPYALSAMSVESRESTASLLQSLWSSYVSDVEALRAKKGLKLQSAIDTMAAGVTAVNGNSAAYAVQAKLADRIVDRMAFTAEMVKRVGEGEDADGLSSFNQINYDTYVAATRSALPSTGDAIAVVYATGEIVDGNAPSGYAGGDTVARHIRQATENDSVKAIVLRVDSPGGSATASEVMRLATLEAQAKGKPVVVSMGSLAASGGYWISATADEIFAQPTTITGSIGVFGMIPTIDRTLSDYGVTTDGVGTTTLAGSETIMRPLSDDVKTILQKGVEHTYAEFLQRVSKGRKLPVAKVDEIAQGRVWDGGTARQLKLVDRFGDLEDAIKSAAARAKLTSWRVTYLEEPEAWQTQILRMLTGTQTKTPKPTLDVLMANQRNAVLRPLTRALTSRGTQAMCLECSAFGSTQVLHPQLTR
jgi:protease IV